MALVARRRPSVRPATQSAIRCTVGLNYSQAQRYVPYLMVEGYLQLSTNQRGRAIYEISARGRQLLEKLNELSQAIDTLGAMTW